jgi:hypothetical protein
MKSTAESRGLLLHILHAIAVHETVDTGVEEELIALEVESLGERSRSNLASHVGMQAPLGYALLDILMKPRDAFFKISCRRCRTSLDLLVDSLEEESVAILS